MLKLVLSLVVLLSSFKSYSQFEYIGTSLDPVMMDIINDPLTSGESIDAEVDGIYTYVHYLKGKRPISVLFRMKECLKIIISIPYDQLNQVVRSLNEDYVSNGDLEWLDYNKNITLSFWIEKKEDHFSLIAELVED